MRVGVAKDSIESIETTASSVSDIAVRAYTKWSPYLLPHTPEPSITHVRPLIYYLYYEIIMFTTVSYGDIIPPSAQKKLGVY
jgi:hypothetical protein